MKQYECEGFRKCVSEILKIDGHTVCEKFLILYVTLFSCTKSNDEELEAETFWRRMLNS